MANKIQVKRSAVPAKTPTTTDLDLGEIAINTNDGKMFIKKEHYFFKLFPSRTAVLPQLKIPTAS